MDEMISSSVWEVIWISVKIILLYFEGKLLNKIALAFSLSTKTLNYASYFTRDLKFLMWFDIVILYSILNLNSWSFMIFFALTIFSPNTLFKLSP